MHGGSTSEVIIITVSVLLLNRFSRALLAIFKQFQPNDIELQPLLKVLEDQLPFHPYVG